MAVWTLIFLKRKYSDIKKGLLEDVAGTVIVLFEDYKLTKWSLLFNVFFFFRRFIYAAIIIFAVDYLLIQAIFFVTLMAILFLYTAIVRPFKLKVISFFMIFNEGVLVALGISNFLFLKPITSKSKDFMLGWVCIAVIIGAICLNLLYLIFVQIKSIVTIVRRLCNKTANGSKSGENMNKGKEFSDFLRNEADKFQRVNTNRSTTVQNISLSRSETQIPARFPSDN